MEHASKNRTSPCSHRPAKGPRENRESNYQATPPHSLGRPRFSHSSGSPLLPGGQRAARQANRRVLVPVPVVAVGLPGAMIVVVVNVQHRLSVAVIIPPLDNLSLPVTLFARGIRVPRPPKVTG